MSEWKLERSVREQRVVVLSEQNILAIARELGGSITFVNGRARLSWQGALYDIGSRIERLGTQTSWTPVEQGDPIDLLQGSIAEQAETIEGLSAEVEALQRDLAGADAQIAGLEAERDSLLESNELLQATVDAFADEVRELEAELARLANEG